MTIASEPILLQSITAQCRLASPLGTLLLARTERGLAGAWFERQKHHPAQIDAPERDDDALLAAAARQLRDYFAGESSDFDVPLDLQGTEFQRAVWRALLRIAPDIISVLDYDYGFGHSELVTFSERDLDVHLETMSHPWNVVDGAN